MNKVMLIGNVGLDPDVRFVDQGVCVAQIRLATSERGYTLANGTEVPERTEWHNVVLWRQLAETVDKYVKKGDKLYIEGKIHTRSYEDKQGRTRAAVMTTVMLFGSGSGAVAGELLPAIGFTGFVIVMLALVVLSAALAAFNPLIRALPASPHWAEVEL